MTDSAPMKYSVNAYQWLRRKKLVPNAVHTFLRVIKNGPHTLSASNELIHEVNAIRLALGEIKSELGNKDAELALLREQVRELSWQQGDRVLHFMRWAHAAQEGRAHRKTE